MSTLADDYGAVQTARAALAPLQTAVNGAQSALTQAQGALAGGQAQVIAAQAQIVADLTADAVPGFVSNPDSSITLLELDPANANGFDEDVIQPATSLAGGAAPPPTPPPSPPSS
jgi:hypothetical protein